MEQQRAEPAVGGSQRRGRGLPPLGVPTKLAYSTGALFDGIGNQTPTIFFFYYATAVCGVPAALVGAALASGLIVDALADPFIGAASDSCHTRFGRRLPFMIAGLPGMMIFLVLLFSLPRGLSDIAMFAWLLVLSLGLRLSTSLYLLPYYAVGAELSDDYTERSSIMAWRWGVALLGALVAIILGFGVFLGGEGGLNHRAAYTPFAVSLAVVEAIGGLLAIRTLWRIRDRQFPASIGEAPLSRRFGREIFEIFRNPSFRALFFGAILLFSSLAVQSALALHANTYFWHMTSGQIQAVTLGLFGGLLFGAPLAGPLLKRLEKRTVLMIGMFGLAAALSLPATLRLAGLFPFTGDVLAGVITTIVFIGGLLMAAAGIAFASMMADVADQHELLFGTRREGLYFAGWSFATKAAAGLGALIGGIALQLMGFHSGGEGAVQHIPPAMADWIGAIYGPGAGLIAALSALACLHYRLDRRVHADILSALDQRRIAKETA